METVAEWGARAGELAAPFVEGAEALVWFVLVFAILALAVKGRRALADVRASVEESKLNLAYYAVDAGVLVPAMAALAAAIAVAVTESGLALVRPGAWDGTPVWLVLLACVAVSDFVGYWRHRAMHLAPLWPVHAIHHSDRAMTWLALARFHPLNRMITTVVSALSLAALGFPPWAVAANGLIRNWYGYYLHADLPWTYGPVVGRIFVSPVLHRWHHTRDRALSGRNFATVFAFYDLLFGSWACPAKDVGPLGIDEPGFPADWLGQTVWPFRVWLGLDTAGRAPRAARAP